MCKRNKTAYKERFHADGLLKKLLKGAIGTVCFFSILPSVFAFIDGKNLLNITEKEIKGSSVKDVFAIAVDRNYVWFGTGDGLYRMKRTEGEVECQEYLPSEKIKKILVDGDTVWFGTLNGLWSYDKKQDVWKNYHHVEGISGQTIYALAADRRYLWAGTLGNGLGMYDKRGNRWRFFRAEEKGGIVSDFIYCAAADGKEVWFGTDKGVAVYNIKKGEWKGYTERDGLACNSVGDIGIDGEDVWFATLAGISRYNRRTGKWTTWTDYNPPGGRDEKADVYRRVNAGPYSVDCLVVGKDHVFFPYSAYDKKNDRWIIYTPMVAGVRAVALDSSGETEVLYRSYWAGDRRGVVLQEINPQSFRDEPPLPQEIKHPEEEEGTHLLDLSGFISEQPSSPTRALIYTGMTMYHDFVLENPERPIRLFFKGVNGDHVEAPVIELSINGRVLFKTVSPFKRETYKPEDRTSFSVYIPSSFLRRKNRLSIRNHGPDWWWLDRVWYTVEDEEKPVTRPVKLFSPGLDANIDWDEESLRVACAISGADNSENFVSVYLKPASASGVYYVFSACPSGERRDVRIDAEGNEDFSWDGDWDVSVSEEENNRWSADFTIPYRILDIPYQHFAFDAGERMFYPEPAFSFDVRKGFGVPEWRVLKQDVDFNEKKYAPFTITDKGNRSWGKNTARITVSKDVPENIVVKMDIFSPTGTVSLTAPAKGDSKVFLPYRVTEEGSHRVVVSLLTQEGKLYYRDGFSFTVLPVVRVNFDRSFYTEREKEATLMVTMQTENVLPEIMPPGLILELYERYTVDVNKGMDKHLKTVPLNANRMLIPLDLSGFAFGNHECLVIVRDKDAREIFRESIMLHRYKKTDYQVQIDRMSNTLIVNGEPFFPVGWWGGTQVAEEMARFGFNTLIDFFPQDGQTYGLMSLYRIKRGDFYTTFEQFEETIKSLRKNPSLLGWYFDEPDVAVVAPEVMNRINDFVRYRDPYHPVVVNFLNAQTYGQLGRDYSRGLDILQVDRYMDDPATMRYWFDSAVKCADGKPAWFWMKGSHFWTGRHPTPAETRCMGYIAITHGATGIFYFLLADIKMALMQMGSFIQEINEMRPILTSPNSDRKVEVNPKEKIGLLIKKYNGKEYMIAVNSDRVKKEVEFKFMDEIKNKVVEVLRENRKIKAEKNSFQDIFEPYGVHIYELIF